MKKYKLLLAVLLVLAMVFTLAACNDNSNGTTPDDGGHHWGDYISDGEEGHHQVCTDPDCDTMTAIKEHTFEYTPLGLSKHKAVCSACGYTIASEDCTFENNACKYCGTKEAEDVGDDGIATIYFHLPDGWKKDSLHVYAYHGEGEELLGAWPGSGTLTDEDGDGWYESKIPNVPKGHVGKDLVVIPNDQVEGEETSHKTGDVVVASATCWIPATAGKKSYDTKEAAERAELGAPGSNDYIIVGDYNSWGETVEDNQYAFMAEAGYTITMEFAANEAFKFKKNSSGWDGEIGYSGLGTITADESLGLSGNLKSLFTKGGQYGTDIVVTTACKLQITLDPTTQKVNIKILLAPGFVPGEVGDKIWYLAGDLSGASWGANEQYKFKANGDGTFTLTNASLGANKQFKVYSSDDEWFGFDQITFAGDLTSNFTRWTKAGDLGDGNVQVTNVCFVELTWDPATSTLTVKNLAGSAA